MEPHTPKRLVNFRPLLFAAVGWILGIVIYVRVWDVYQAYAYFNASKFIPIIILLSAIAVMVILAVTFRRVMLFTVTVAMLLGMARTALAIPVIIPIGQYSILGTVYEINTDESGAELTLQRVSIDGNSIDYDVFLTIPPYNAVQVQVGDSIEAYVWGGTPERGDSTFDRRMYLLSNRASAEFKSNEVSILSHDNAPITQMLHNIREGLGNAISNTFGENSAIMEGFLIGNRAKIDSESRAVFNATGTAHILALSGFHVGIFAGILMKLLPKHKPWLRFIIITVFLFCYCAITEFSPSLVRASIMCLCVLLADAVARRHDSLSSISLAALILLIANPFMLWSVSFLLSFTAVLGILLTGAGRHRSKLRVLSTILNGLSVSFGAGMASALLSSRYFGVFPIYSIIANTIAIPLYTVSITMGVLLVPLYYVYPSFAKLLAVLPNTFNNTAMYILEGISKLPYSVIRVSSPSMLSCVLFMIMLFVLSKYLLRPISHRLRFALPVMVLFTASLFMDIITA